MATLTTSWQLLDSKYLGSSYGDLYVRLYGKYSEQDIANNRSYVYFQSRAYFGPKNYISDKQGNGYVSGSAGYATGTCTYITGGNEVIIATSEKWIDHDTAGNLTVSGNANLKFPNWGWSGTAGAVVDLPRIPRQATITSVSDFNDVTNPTVYFNHPAGSALELQACIMSGDTQITSYRRLTDAEIARGSYTFNLKEAYDDGTTPESRIWARSVAVGSDTIDVTFRLATWLGTAFGYTDSETKKCTITDCAPKLSPTIKDVGTNSTRLTGPDSDKIIKGHNYLEVSTGAVGVKGATITSQSISCAGITIHAASGPMMNVEGGTFVITATDNRGKTTTTTVTKELINYEKLTCNLSIGNPTPDGDLDFQISGNYFDGNFGAIDNSLKVEYRLVVAGTIIDEMEWFQAGDNVNIDAINITSIGPSITNNTYAYTMNVSGLDYRTTYIIQARAADEVYTGYLTTSERAVRCMPVFDWGPDDFKFNVPVNINDFIEIGEEVDINVPVNINDGADISGPVNFKGPITTTDDVHFEGSVYKDGNPVGYYPIGGIYMSDNNTNPGTLFGGTWQLMRSFYGGELLAYGTAWNSATSNKAFAFNTSTYSYYGVSDILGGIYTDSLHNYVSNILMGSSGTIFVQTQGIVGMVEANVEISGLNDNSGCYGIWFGRNNKNELPTGVTLNGGGTLHTINGHFGGNSTRYFYNINDNDQGSSFFVNPEWMPYGGTFIPCHSGTKTVLQVKAFAKGGTTYMWKRIA